VWLQLLRFSLDRDGIDVGLEASFGMAGLGMEPLLLEPDIGAWRTEGSDKGVAMAGSATLRAGDACDFRRQAAAPQPGKIDEK
jgi:hypothetical protein